MSDAKTIRKVLLNGGGRGAGYDAHRRRVSVELRSEGEA